MFIHLFHLFKFLDFLVFYKVITVFIFRNKNIQLNSFFKEYFFWKLFLKSKKKRQDQKMQTFVKNILKNGCWYIPFSKSKPKTNFLNFSPRSKVTRITISNGVRNTVHSSSILLEEAKTGSKCWNKIHLTTNKNSSSSPYLTNTYSFNTQLFSLQNCLTKLTKQTIRKSNGKENI